MVNPAKIVFVSILLGCLLYFSPSNPFAFVPPYVDLPAMLEALCCIVVSAAICYTSAAYWSRASAAEHNDANRTEHRSRIAVKALRACALAWAAYMACSFLALLLHYCVGFNCDAAVVYTGIVIGLLAVAEASLRHLHRPSGYDLRGKDC